MQNEILVKPRTTARVSAAAIAVVVALHAASQTARFAFGHDYQLGLASRLYLGAEMSLPNWLSTILLVACAAALLAVGAAARRDRGRWIGLAVIFVALSVDEAAALHDLASPLFSGVFVWLAHVVGGPFIGLARKPNYGWEIPGAMFAIGVAAAYWPFLLRLPSRTRVLFMWSGAIYVGAAVGVDFVEGWYSGLHGAKNPTFVALVTAEESLEMVGVSLFLYAVLSHAEAELGEMRIGFSPVELPDDYIGPTADTRARSAAAERRSPTS